MNKKMVLGIFGEFYVVKEFYSRGAQAVDHVDHDGIDLVVYGEEKYAVSVKTRDVVLTANGGINLKYSDFSLLYSEAKIRGLVPLFAFSVQDADGMHVLVVELWFVFSELLGVIGREIGSVENYFDQYSDDKKHATLCVSISPSVRHNLWPSLQGMPGVIFVK